VLLCGPFPDPVGGVSVHLARLRAVLGREPVWQVQCVDEAALRKPALFNIRSLQWWRYLRLMWWADIVHVHSSVLLLRAMHVLLAALLGKRVVLTIHSHRPASRGAHLLARWLCRVPQAVIAVNDDIRLALCPRALVIPAYITPSADEEKVPDDIAAWAHQVKAVQGKQLMVSNAYKLVLHDGQDLYGLDLLIDLFADPAIRAQYCLLFVVSSLAGCEERYQMYQQRIAERGLEQSILLLNRAMPFAGLLQLCDVSVRATNTDGDALSIRESLSYGKRTLASDCVARPDGVELFRSRDGAALRSVLQQPPRSVAAAAQSFDRAVINLYRNFQ
jgi:glycosyltransferase involved in cell wall biosynthesis